MGIRRFRGAHGTQNSAQGDEEAEFHSGHYAFRARIVKARSLADSSRFEAGEEFLVERRGGTHDQGRAAFVGCVIEVERTTFEVGENAASFAGDERDGAGVDKLRARMDTGGGFPGEDFGES